MPDKRIRAGAFCRSAPWIIAVAAAVMPLAASAQSPLAGSAQSQPSAQSGVATAPAPKQVDLNAVPQANTHEMTTPRIVPRPRTTLSDQQYQALKDEAARRRFDMRNLQPLPPPANPSSGSIPGAP